MNCLIILLTSLLLWAGAPGLAQPGDNFTRGASRPWTAADSALVRQWLSVGLGGRPPSAGISTAWAGAASGGSLHIDSLRFGGHSVDPPCDADHARMLIYNTTQMRLKYCTGTEWRVTAVDQDNDGLTLELDDDDDVPFLAGSAEAGHVLAPMTFFHGPTMTRSTGIISDSVSGHLADVDADFLPQNVRSGVSLFGLIGTYPSLQDPLPGGSSDPTAGAGQVLVGYEAWSDTGAVIDGTMPDRGTPVYTTPTPSTSTVAVALQDGYHAGGTCQAPGDPDLVPAKIKNGIALFGVVGVYPSSTNPLPGGTADATASGGQILSGYEAWSEAGSLLDGTMANRGAPTYTTPTPSTGTVSVALNTGYHAGGSCQAPGDPDLAPGNIRAGVNIFGVTGNVQAQGSTAGCGSWSGGTCSGTQLYDSGWFGGSMGDMRWACAKICGMYPGATCAHAVDYGTRQCYCHTGSPTSGEGDAASCSN